MMHKSNILAMVFANERNKVQIWDDSEKRIRTAIKFNSDVIKIKLQKDVMIVVLHDKSFIFDFTTFKMLKQIKTCENPLGICAVNQSEKPVFHILCLPDPE